MTPPSPTGERILESLAAEPWLLAPELELCVVGSSALRIGCEREGLPLPPRPGDVDLAWRPSLEEGRALLAEHGAHATGSPAAAARGTLHARLGGRHIELTSFRGGGASLEERIAEDALRRESTIGALFVHLATGELHDPQGGLEDWRRGRVRACGDPEARLREHPIRALRYLRRSTELGFDLDLPTRKTIRELAAELCPGIDGPALAEELRKALLSCQSPGVFLLRLHDEGLLGRLLPELAALFDGRPAGRIEHHPEISLALHMVLALKEAADLSEQEQLNANERLELVLSVLCHDLGKGCTPPSELPSHPGHEHGGLAPIGTLWRRLPGLADKRVRRLCEAVAEQHRRLVHLRELRSTTIVQLWESSLDRLRDSHALLARAARCDRAGRLTREDVGLVVLPRHRRAELPPATEKRILQDLAELDELMRSVRGDEARERFGNDHAALREHLHSDRVRILREAGFGRTASVRRP